MQIPEDIVIRSIQNTATGKELRILRSWLSEDKKNLVLYLQFEEIWNIRKDLSEEAKKQGWQMLSKQIEKQAQSNLPLKNKQKFLSWRNLVAAIVGVLIASSIWSIIPINENKFHRIVENTIYNKSGIQSVILPDNSEVWLHEDSHISFPEIFNKAYRQANLEGKAYFDIRKDLKRPFYVQIGKVMIEVTGTEFFVEASSDNKSSVTLISGKVNLNYTNNFGKPISIPLNPGQQALINGVNLSVDIKNINADYYHAWKDGIFRFDYERLDKITELLAIHYNLDIYVDPSLKDKRFTGRIRTEESIEDVLKSIMESYPVNCYITGDKISITKKK